MEITKRSRKHCNNGLLCGAFEQRVTCFVTVIYQKLLVIKKLLVILLTVIFFFYINSFESSWQFYDSVCRKKFMILLADNILGPNTNNGI
jgi:ubiquitin C-terminal hydrolase